MLEIYVATISSAPSVSRCHIIALIGMLVQRRPPLVPIQRLDITDASQEQRPVVHMQQKKYEGGGGKSGAKQEKRGCECPPRGTVGI